MIRSRVTLATIDAAAIDRHSASPPMIACGPACQVARNHVAVDQHMIRREGQGGDGAAHGQVAGAQDVDGVDLFHAGMADADLGAVQKRCEQRLALPAVKLLGVVQSGGNAIGTEPDGSGGHRARQRTTPGLVDADDEAGTRAMGRGFEKEVRSVHAVTVPKRAEKKRGWTLLVHPPPDCGPMWGMPGRSRALTSGRRDSRRRAGIPPRRRDPASRGCGCFGHSIAAGRSPRLRASGRSRRSMWPVAGH